ncbi:hypothetical protein J3Q64DRAFT_1760755 [Phycomyces blakesleeanus]|uniref:BTB domain-containing protein n=2 Tax=Phycomyces blakesleeanus TaxID=4837 RepID=A0A162WLP3_PHYB8|nr:hypothetical protein PHYBLDRAFT_183000 [Phycomyces blakesleeanus NRRL 1555(-)]OAD68895.1 hypothetical protein PHYBLDRAFT_183000 [Phycomyces blakesleeanus NRRL 1555(-)]|eukprot:XP_018286935.1 hypothetical protein PHYBLDRAFT_183000 [Phycomyces blakesleeanus NRRL 1555(-)]
MTERFVFEDAPPNVIVAMGPDHRSSTAAKTDIQLESGERTRWSCHKAVLAKHSPYFSSMFESEFRESRATIVFLPRGIFTVSALDGILHYMYTAELVANTPPLLGDIYSAADYLGMQLLCSLVADRIRALGHQFNCYCESCQTNVPQILEISRAQVQYQEDDQQMIQIAQAAIKVMTHDPDKTLQTFYTSPELADQLKNAPEVHDYFNQQILERINKGNAIESLYGCFVGLQALQKNDPNVSWSQPLHTTLQAAHSIVTRTIASHFYFYCSEYPSLLSCVDGISYTPEFLSYLLTKTLSNEMNENNTAVFYTGIVRQLMCRHAVQHGERVKEILQVAKDTILAFMASHVDQLRTHHILDQLDKGLLETLAQDLSVLPKVLVHPEPEPPKNHHFFARSTQPPPPPPPPVRRRVIAVQEVESSKKPIGKVSWFLKHVFVVPFSSKTAKQESKRTFVEKTKEMEKKEAAFSAQNSLRREDICQ